MLRATDTLPHRRALITGLATAPAALAMPALASPAGPDPDAELVRLWQEWRRAYNDADTCPDEVFDAAMTVRYRIEDKIRTTPAVGLAGLAVKGKLAAHYGAGAWSLATEALIEDVLRTAGAADDPDILRAA